MGRGKQRLEAAAMSLMMTALLPWQESKSQNSSPLVDPICKKTRKKIVSKNDTNTQRMEYGQVKFRPLGEKVNSRDVRQRNGC
jgi:hypothetical protein